MTNPLSKFLLRFHWYRCGGTYEIKNTEPQGRYNLRMGYWQCDRCGDVRSFDAENY